MITHEEARARVARGAAHLDQVRPGWADQIDIGQLELASCFRCVLGQLFDDGGGESSGFDVGLLAMGFRSPSIWQVWGSRFRAVRAGFVLAECELEDQPAVFDSAYRVLQDAWIEAIADRRLRSQEAREASAAVDAVDPQAASTGNPAPREKVSV